MSRFRNRRNRNEAELDRRRASADADASEDLTGPQPTDANANATSSRSSSMRAEGYTGGEDEDLDELELQFSTVAESTSTWVPVGDAGAVGTIHEVVEPSAVIESPEVAQSQQAMQAEGDDLARAFDGVEGTEGPATTDTGSADSDDSEPVMIKLVTGLEIDLKVFDGAISGDLEAYRVLREITGQKPLTPQQQKAYQTLGGIPMNEVLGITRGMEIGGMQPDDREAFMRVMANRATDLEMAGALDLVTADMFKDPEAMSEYFMSGTGRGLTDAQKVVVADAGGAGLRDLLGIERQQELGSLSWAGSLGGDTKGAEWIAEELAERTEVVTAEIDAVVVKALNGDLESYVKLRALYGLETTGAQRDQYLAAGGAGVAESLGHARQYQVLGSTEERTETMAAVDARLGTLSDLAQRALDGDATALAQIGAALPGETLTPELLTLVVGFGGTSSSGTTTGTTSTGPSTTGSTSGTVPVNQADASMDRMGSGASSPTSSSSPPVADGSQAGGDADAYVPRLPSPSEPGGAFEFNSDDTASRAAGNLADWADGVAGQIGATGSGGDGSTAGLATGTNEGPKLTSPTAIVDIGEGLEESGSYGFSKSGATSEGRNYTDYKFTDSGFQRVYDDGAYQMYNSDGTARGSEVNTHSSDTSDATNQYEGTTDNDEESPDDDDDSTDDSEVDDGDSATATAYVNPDADQVTFVMSSVVLQTVATGVDPTTTTPSGPYVDDSPTPFVATTGTVHLGLGVPLRPGITDANPELEPIFGSPSSGLNPEGPDTVDPTDPTLGVGGEDINVGDFTPPPSFASPDPVGEGAPEGGFDPDPFD